MIENCTRQTTNSLRPLSIDAGSEGDTAADCENSSRRDFWCFKFYKYNKSKQGSRADPLLLYVSSAIIFLPFLDVDQGQSWMLNGWELDIERHKALNYLPIIN